MTTQNRPLLQATDADLEPRVITPAKPAPMLGVKFAQTDVLIAALMAGHSRAVACDMASIGFSTLKRWMALGCHPDSNDRRKPAVALEPYAGMVARIVVAEAYAESRALMAITNAWAKDWKAAAWYLSRKYPERWGTPAPGVQVATSGAVVLLLPDNHRDDDPDAAG